MKTPRKSTDNLLVLIFLAIFVASSLMDMLEQGNLFPAAYVQLSSAVLDSDSSLEKKKKSLIMEFPGLPDRSNLTREPVFVFFKYSISPLPLYSCFLRAPPLS